MAAFFILNIKGNVLAGLGRAGPRVGIYTGRAGPGLFLPAVNAVQSTGRAGPGRRKSARAVL